MNHYEVLIRIMGGSNLIDRHIHYSRKEKIKMNENEIKKMVKDQYEKDIKSNPNKMWVPKTYTIHTPDNDWITAIVTETSSISTDIYIRKGI